MTENNAACEWHPEQSQKETTPATLDLTASFATRELPVEPNRYRLIWGKFCPWATPVAIVLRLLGLEQAVSDGTVQALRRTGLPTDWVYGADDSVKDPVLGTARLSESYQQAAPEFNGRASVPTLVDVTTGKAVNNQSNDLLDEFARYWRQYQTTELDLYPEERANEVAAINQIILTDVTEVPGQILVAQSQAEYDELAQRFFNRLEWADHLLATQPYLVGETLTVPDIRLFVSLVRFDIVYYYQNKLSAHRLVDYPNLWAYAKRLYQIPAFKETTDFTAIKQHFYQVSEAPVTSFDRVVPFGIDEAKWDQVD
ncbi:glutathione S-transferase [Paucilactobacillus vaccinostercus DSM 20634]|uniref:Glutathione S-transferase n=1 Tax=Paucilactobacillus vaccinostercus DSM 20634 TaxID=1423813 RepID=A0A0R2A1Q9_9LACO|nr:glutathione S-transferase C-terminal domain-containing protein [Paucilactobacillus vaccinostercus]KRM61214.1 glutathione S-transferase [Paucilactobacillus vaccinostercus DSM 20634]